MKRISAREGQQLFTPIPVRALCHDFFVIRASPRSPREIPRQQDQVLGNQFKHRRKPPPRRPPDVWYKERATPPPRNYIGEKALQILEQHRQGVPVPAIAQNLGVSIMTVYRHLDRAGLRKRQAAYRIQRG